MTTIKIKMAEVVKDTISEQIQFPKYTSLFINWANRFSQGTRPNVVGKMTDLIQEFPGRSYNEWVEWYKAGRPDTIDVATERVCQMIQNFKAALDLIDRDMVKTWIEDLVLTKTYVGLHFQESILKRVSELKNTAYRISTPAEESQGIDGFIGDRPVSIKPITYKAQVLSEEIIADMIYYEKDDDNKLISVEFNF
jgi:hypothetical protein